MTWPIIDSLSPDERRQFLATARRRKFGRREVIFHEGDPGDSMHLVDTGRVAIRITTPLGDVATLDVLGPGSTMGELALLRKEGKRTATAIALEPASTLAVHRDAFIELLQTHPECSAVLVEALAVRVTDLSERLSEALYVPAEKRVVRRLMGLACEYASGDGDATVEIAFTQEDLASLAGTSRATVNRVLGELEEEGVLKVARGRVAVFGAERLARRGR